VDVSSRLLLGAKDVEEVDVLHPITFHIVQKLSESPIG
jgi:hypothetical protein